MKVSDEQLREIGLAASAAFKEPQEGWKEYNARCESAGRAAFEESCQIALSEPTSEELRDAGGLPDGNCNSAAARKLFANRLKSLTAQPDPAVDAVKAALKGTLSTQMADIAFGEAMAENIVAAVDSARGRK